LSAGVLRNSFKGAASAAPFVPNLLDQLPNAIIIFDGKTKHLFYANPAAESALDLSRKAIVGHSLDELFADNPALNGMIEEVANNVTAAQRQEMILHVFPIPFTMTLFQRMW
jgi:two-component system, NtrC family, nitrogen regulation sensor histidine kinase GlnL